MKQKLQDKALYTVALLAGRVIGILNRIYVSPKWIQVFALDAAPKILSSGLKVQACESFPELNTII